VVSGGRLSAAATGARYPLPTGECPLLPRPFRYLEKYTVPKHSLLAIFGHPDDESGVGPMLARYAAEGHDVWLVSITSGQRGFRAHFNMPIGDELGRVREEELRCSARALGIHEPFLLGYQDQGIAPSSVAEEVAGKLRDIIAQTRADVLLSWGPDGITGHIDHRMSSALASCVFQQQAALAYKPRKLYFLAFPESLFLANPDPLDRKRHFLTVSDEFVTTVIDTREYLDVGLKAMQCHKSQWRPERMAQVHQMYTRLFGAKAYLRLELTRVKRPTAIETSVFEGLD
jgi:LmbE family N-acetylglucosaminyl deacetylase